jgi:hypothetical protein
MAEERKKVDLLSDVSKGQDGEIIRNYCPFEGIKWRHGALPDYSTVNKLYFAERTKKHPAGSLAEIVQNLVKNWEIEQHNISDTSMWQTMDTSKLKIFINGKGGYSASDLSLVGPYNAMIGDSHPGYEASKEDFLSAEKLFKDAMPRGFAWEVLEVFSGPPNVSFTWRHWGYFEGPYKEHQPTGKLVEIFGHTIARVNDKLQIEELSLFFDPGELIREFIKK